MDFGGIIARQAPPDRPIPTRCRCRRTGQTYIFGVLCG
ncbi:unknown [Alistipes sp. CAG:831]|nr:unknown [Alistipes sp. CAG:831]